MTNTYLGEIDLKVGEKVYTLVYDWAALAAIASEFGKDAIQKISEFAYQPDKLAKIVIIGAKKKNPDLTLEVLMEASLPIVEVCNTVELAITYAYFGKVPGLDELSGKKDELSEDSKKKTS